MTGAEQLAKAAWIEDGQEVHEFNGATVTSVNPDGTVNLNYLGENHLNITAMTSYLDRHSGDFVIVRSNGDHWIVIGKVGIEYDPQSHVVIPPIPGTPVMPPSVTWGTTDPVGTGWNVIIANSAWGNNDGRIYFKTATGTPPPPVVQPPDTPGSGTVYTNITPQAAESWTNPTDDALNAIAYLWYSDATNKNAQGKLIKSGYNPGPYAGSWYYNHDLENAANKNPSKMELWLKRDTGDFGPSGPVTPKIYIHQGLTLFKGALPVDAGPWTGPQLTPGQGAWWTVPASVVTQLKTAGSSRAFMIYSGLTSDLMTLTTDSGLVRVTS